MVSSFFKSHKMLMGYSYHTQPPWQMLSDFVEGFGKMKKAVEEGRMWEKFAADLARK